MFSGINDIVAFISATIVLLLIPGPSTFYIAGQTAKHGIKDGFTAVSGVMLADTILMALSIFGIASLLKAFPLSFTIIQFIGAMYLIYLGIQNFRSSSSEQVEGSDNKIYSIKKAFLITFLNPKGFLFFMAFFPLFIDFNHERYLMNFLILATLFQVISLIHQGCLILVVHYLKKKLFNKEAKNSRIGVWFKKATGGLFIGFGAKLAIGA